MFVHPTDTDFPLDLLPDPFAPVDLSLCRTLERLHISVLLHRPGVIAETALPSIISSQLSYISLHLESDPMDEVPEVDYLAWTLTENHLRRLAERFSSGNSGQKMEVVISVEDLDEHEKSHFLDRVSCKKFLPRLKEEAKFRIVKDRGVPGSI
jgi:hypothetical protein